MGLLQLYIYVCVFMCMNTYINAWIDVVLECPWDGAADGSPPAIYIYVCVYPYACIHIYMHKLRTCINTYCIRMSVRRRSRRASSSYVYKCARIHMHVYIYTCMNYMYTWIHIVSECPWEGAADGRLPAMYIFMCMYPYACLHIYLHELCVYVNTYCIRMSMRRRGRRASSNAWWCAWQTSSKATPSKGGVR